MKSQWPYKTIACFLLSLICGLQLYVNSVSADDVVDIINVTVPVSCSISGTGMNTHNANINNNTYQANIGTTTLHAFCNDNNGFAIYAAGYTGDEVGGINSTKLVGTNVSNAAIETGLATSAGNPDVSNWAMKLAISQDSGDTSGTNALTIDSDTEGPFSAYHTVPNEYKKVAHKNSATDMTESTGGVKLTTTYAAYISRTQPADTYSGKVIYLLIHPSNASTPGYYTIVYNANGGSGTMSSDRALTYEPFTLKANEFTAPSNSSFLGWCTTNTSQYNCDDGVSYANEASVIGLAAADDTINLYAYWTEPMTFNRAMQEAGKTKLNGYYKIQDVTSSICTAVETGQIGQVIDSRDNEVYYITKLNNGRCWMMDNLRLGSSSSINLSPSNTNIATSYTLPASTTSTFDLYSVAKLNAQYKNDIAPVTYGSGSGKVGVYYNYCAATAGTFCYDEEQEQGDCAYPAPCYYRDQANSVYDICPVGWGMPTAHDGGDYSGTDRNTISISLSGRYYSSQLQLGSVGWFWSKNHSTLENYGQREMLLVDTRSYDYKSSTSFLDRAGGASVRCVLSNN